MTEINDTFTDMERTVLKVFIRNSFAVGTEYRSKCPLHVEIYDYEGDDYVEPRVIGLALTSLIKKDIIKEMYVDYTTGKTAVSFDFEGYSRALDAIRDESDEDNEEYERDESDEDEEANRRAYLAWKERRLDADANKEVWFEEY